MIAKPPQKEAKLLWECFGELKERAKTECMTPKEKAEELVDKFYRIIKHPELDCWEDAKECALIAVDEIIKLVDSIYWQEVKTELTKP